MQRIKNLPLLCGVKQLKDLLDNKMITQQEYDIKKKEIIDSL
jgi:hypothetical protein